MDENTQTTGTGMAVQTPKVTIMPPTGPEILRRAEEQRAKEQDVVERLMAQPPRRSESIAQLALALSQAQGEMGSALRDSTNPFFKSKYASRAAVRAAYQEALTKYKLALLQPTQAIGRSVLITTILVHESGEYIEATLGMTAKDDTPQVVAAAVTYGLRIAAVAMTGVAAEDDDGETNTTHSPEGVKHDRANTPLQRAAARAQDAGGTEAAQPVSPVAPGNLPAGTPTGGSGSAVGTAPPVRPPARPAAPQARPAMVGGDAAPTGEATCTGTRESTGGI